MALDVGELVYRLTVDDSRFIQSNQAAVQTASQTATRINSAMQGASTGINNLATNAQQAARQLAQVELNRGLDQAAQNAATRLAELRTNAQQAGQTTEQIALNQAMIRDAIQATNEIETLRTNAQQAASAVDDITLQNQLSSQLQAAQQELDRVLQNANQAAAGVGSIGTEATQAANSVSLIGQATAGAVSGMASIGGAISSSAGHNTAGSFLAGFSDKLGDLAGKTGPIAGSLLGVAVIGLAAGAALAAAIQDGLQSEMDRDLFQAQTGVTEGQARKFGLASGESFADAFGESINGNLGTAQSALENGLLDPGATQRDIEKVINSLDGVSTILGEDIPAVAHAAGNAVKSGFAGDFQDALDLLVKGKQIGLNASGDLLDTVSEYSIQFNKVGLSGAEAFGLMNQAVKGGARDTDTAADAIKEFAIKSIDGSKGAAEAYQALGFNAEEMSAKIAKGGEEGSEGMRDLLTEIRKIEDPLIRNTVAVGLFGTKAEDLGNAMFELDLSTAVQSMNDYEGAAWRAINVMGDNAGTSVQGAMNSISAASTGMKEAMAQAFGPYIKKFADGISDNRAGVIQFFIDVGNGGFEAAKSVLGFVEGGLRGLADFADAGTDMSVSFLRSVGDMLDGLGMLSNIPFIGDLIPDMGDVGSKLDELANQAETGGAKISAGLRTAADGVHDTLIPSLGQAQDRFNDFAGSMKLSAAFNDQSSKVNKAIAQIGVDADGAALKVDNWTGAIDRNNVGQVKMEDGIKGMADGFRTQIRTGLEAGNTVEALTGQYEENRVAILEQIGAVGIKGQAAIDYLNVLGLTPDFVDTTILTPGMPEAKYELDVLKGKVKDVPDGKVILTEALTKDATDSLDLLGVKTRTLPNGEVEVYAETKEATIALEEWLIRNGRREIAVKMKLERINGITSDAPVGSTQRMQDYINGGAFQADGSIRTRADGMIDTAHIQQGSGQGITTRSPLGPVRYAEGETDWEAYIPGAMSKRKRSEQILAETAKRFGFGLINFDDIPAMADGSVVESMEGIVASKFPALLQNGKAFSSYRSDGSTSYHNSGQAADFSNGSGNTDDQLAFANYMADNYQKQLAELIYIDPRFGRCIKDGEFVPDSFYAGAGDHTNHVHAAAKQALGAPAGTGAAPAGPDNRTEREKITDQVIAEGKKRGISDKGIKAAVMTALAETDMQNLDHGMDGDNAGIMQQRSQGWGTLEDRKDPTKAAGMFYDKLDDFDYNAMSEAAAAQKVQQSGTADGSNYAVKAGEADELIAASNARGQMTVGTTDSGAALATDGQRVYVTNWPGSGSASYSAGTSESAPPSAPAGGTSGAAAKDPNLLWSGGFQVFENGGMNLPSEAGLYSDGADLIRFAEKGTGGEAYIPLGAQNRNRSVAVTRETARRFGFDLVPMADGGLTGFGGYVGEQDGVKVPTSANGRRAAAYNALAFGVGGAFAIGSGWDADGNFTGQFDTNNNSNAGLEKQLGALGPTLEKILEAVKEKVPITAEVHVDQSTGMANIAILKGRL
ncbi:hypothetical protein B2J88_08085 [Rhodococcus sp. SRB_17]|nr:hypothetical protein [Rhodococcus sp. SRB_17]